MVFSGHLTLYLLSHTVLHYDQFNWPVKCFPSELVSLSLPPLAGNGDILSFEDYYTHRKETEVAGIMIARLAVDL